MTILVTGSAGHLGEALMRTFRATGVAARGIDRKPSPYTDLVGSITDRDLVGVAMEGVSIVLHTATLHKPHVVTHSAQDFIDTNISGTLALLEAAVAQNVRGFVFTSTTSSFGGALTPAPDQPAAWITEDVVPIPKNIYGATKIGAEQICELFARKHGLPVLILRTSRFFPEDDDSEAVRTRFTLSNIQALELLYRRADIADVVSAHLRAIERAPEIGFGRYIVSATSPFGPEDLADLHRDAERVILRLHPEAKGLFDANGWQFLPLIDRVYVNDRARADLRWTPRHDFAHVLACLRAGTDFRSALALEVGSKGYHEEVFAEGPFPVE